MELEGIVASSSVMLPIDAPPGYGDVYVESLDTCRALALLKELSLKVTEDSPALMPALLSFVKHDAHVVVRQSIATGTCLFPVVLEKMALQLHKSGKAKRWLEELWDSMVKFKDTMHDILTAEKHESQPNPVGIKMLAVKFLEVYVVLFTSDANSIKLPCTEGKGKKFSLSWFAEGNPLLNPSVLASEANRTLAFLLDILQSASNLHGSLTIVVINCLTDIARNRPVHYSRVLSALLDFDSNTENLKRGHAASIQYSIRTSLLRFLQCTHPLIIESRDKLLKSLRAMYPGEATEQIIHRLEKTSKSAGHGSQDVRLSKDDSKKPMVQACSSVADAVPAKRTRLVMDAMSSPPAETDSNFLQEEEDDFVNGFSSSLSMASGKTTEVEKMLAKIGALMAEGERATESLDILISNIHADLMADIVIDNMKHLRRSTTSSKRDALTAGSMALPVPNNAIESKAKGFFPLTG